MLIFIVAFLVTLLLPNSASLPYLDPSVDPCNDFYQYSCGNFDKVYQIQDDENYINNFKLLEKTLLKLGNEILSSKTKRKDPLSLKKAKSAYRSCLDTNYTDNFFGNDLPELRVIDEYGGFPMIRKNNNPIFNWNTIGKMVSDFGLPLLFDFVIYPRLDNTEDYMVIITGDSLSNPSLIRPQERTYEDILTHSFKNYAANNTVQPFDKFLFDLTKLIVQSRNPNKTDEEIQSDINDVATFMRNLARGGVRFFDYQLYNNTKVQFVTDGVRPFRTQYPTLKELQEWTFENFGNQIEIDWVEYFANVFSKTGINVTENLITYPQSAASVYGVLNLVRQTNPDVVKNFALLRIFLFMAPDSVGRVRNIFETYYRAKKYTLYPRWEYCTRKILDIDSTASMNFAVAYAYQKYFFNADKINQANELLDIIRDSFEDILENSDWMDDDSREAALIKAQNMIVLLGYPDFVDEREKLDRLYRDICICEWDNYGNSKNLRAFRQAYLFKQLGKPRTRSFWDKSTFDTNAYYNRANNKIVLPMAMLNAPYFEEDPIKDLARLGSIIGHEITHGFDVAGQKYDQFGVQKPWFSSETLERFQNKTKCFVDQYNSYHIDEIDANVNGANTLNENLADNGGLRSAYNAFKKLDFDFEQRIGNYTLEQIFFLNYAESWCSVETSAYMKSVIKSDHAPNRFRVNGPVSNMVEFAKAFNCPSGSPMNPDKKCILW